MARAHIDFIVVGAQKAGTTALHDFLSEDPAYAVSRTKEVHFFDDETVNWNAPDYAPYHAQFDWNRDAIRGEATPIYLYWPRSLERIAVYNPAIKLIVMLRDPVERAWSHWRMETARGVETRPFDWCIREGRARLFDAEPWGVHREYSYVERGFYGEQMARLLDLFPREQVLVLKADELRRAPVAALARVGALLGNPAPQAVEPRDVHVGKEVGAQLAASDVAFLREIYAEDMARLSDLISVRFW